MAATVVWESRFGKTNEQPGLEVTRKIWNDMRQLAGCIDSEILRDPDEPGHILVISHWTSAEAAAATKNRYAAHPNALMADELATEPRRHFVGMPDITAGQEAA